MRELKVIDVDKMADVRSLSGQFYRKSEVDDVIEYLQNQLSLARTGLIKLLAKAQHEAHHNKYKRCLAMAKLCNEKWLVHNFAEVPTKLRFYNKWENRWLELAEKFKEA